MTEHKTPAFEHVLVQSRHVIVEMMEERGYDVGAYKNFDPTALIKISIDPEALTMVMSKNDDKDKKAIITYHEKNIKNSLSGILTRAAEEIAEGNLNPEQTEFIYILHNPIVDTFSLFANNAWNKYKLRYQFFHIKSLVSNPMRHFLQPKFELLTEEEAVAVLKENYIRSKSQLPIIKYHEDMVARYMGLVPGSIVRITRPSPTAGSYELYRLCAP